MLLTLARTTAKTLLNAAANPPIRVGTWVEGRAQLPDGRYATHAREGYMANEIVFAAIRARATSASEPRMHVRSGAEWSMKNPVLDVLRYPNPGMDGVQFWQTVITHLDLAGDAYALKVRSRSQRVVQMMILRPDRVEIVPDAYGLAARYNVLSGDGTYVPIPASDVIHWRTPNPLDDFHGLSPLRAASGRIDIDNFMRDFTKAYFSNSGIPAGMMAIKGKISKEARDEMKAGWRESYGGPSGWHSLLVVDGDATFTPFTANLGASGLMVPELDKQDVRRICTVLEVPPALIGVDDAPTSYAALEMIQRFFWENAMAPLYKELAATLNGNPKDGSGRGLLADFPGIDEIAFDLSDVRALREDEDAVSKRIVGDIQGSLRSIEEGRSARGLPALRANDTFLVPSNMVLVKGSDLQNAKMGPETPPPALPAPTEAVPA